MDQSLMRRQFLKRFSLAAIGLGATMARLPSALAADAAPPALLPQRKFGRHDFTISSLGLGGSSLRSVKDDREAFAMVDYAIDHGLTFMDNAWEYYAGQAEDLMGRALVGKRDKVFLMTKVCTHSKGSAVDATRMLEESLQRLRTDRLDLWQLHQLDTAEQIERAFGPGGTIEVMQAAQMAGKVRFLGFTGHRDPEVHLAMLQHRFPWDACQMPLSPFDTHHDSFQKIVLPELVAQNIAPLAMKTLLGKGIPITAGIVTIKEALSYVLSLPIATLITGATSLKQLTENIAVAQAFQAMSPADMAALEKHCAPFAADGTWEWYKHAPPILDR